MKNLIQAADRRPRLFLALFAFLYTLGMAVNFATAGRTINVASYGAVPSDGRDDSAAIKAAIAAASSGDTVVFGEGMYNVVSQVDANTGLTFQGVHGKTVINAPSGAQAFKVSNGHSATINDFNFNGGVLFIDGKAKVVITGNDLTNYASSGDIGCGRGAIGGTGAQLTSGSLIKNNDFHDSQDGRSIYFFTAFDTVIEDNNFRNVFLGIKSNNADIVKAKNLTIRRNYFTENRYHSVELQGTIDGFWFTDNYYEHPRLSNNFNDNNSTFAWSLIYTAPSTDQHILRNFVNAPERPDGTGIRLSLEIGEFAEVKDNYVRGGGTVLTVYGPGTVVDGNNFDGARWGTGYIYGSQRGLTNSVITSNNGATTKLTWEINRAKPGPYVQPSSPSPVITMTLAVAPVASASNDTVAIKLTNVPSDAVRVDVTTVSTSGREAGSTTAAPNKVGPMTSIAAGMTSVMASGYHPAWLLDFVATAYDTAGKAIATATVTRVQLPGTNGGIAWPPLPTVPPTTQPVPPPTLPVEPDIDLIIPRRGGVYGMPTTRAA